LLISREEINVFPQNFASLFLGTKTRGQDGQNNEKSVLNPTLGDGISCSSERKHERKRAPRQKLFVSKRRLQKHILQCRNLCNEQTYGKLSGNKDGQKQ
jgi:hypothetical protein